MLYGMSDGLLRQVLTSIQNAAARLITGARRLCAFGRRGRQTQTRTLCIRRTLCRHVTIGTPMVIFAVLTIF